MPAAARPARLPPRTTAWVPGAGETVLDAGFCRFFTGWLLTSPREFPDPEDVKKNFWRYAPGDEGDGAGGVGRDGKGHHPGPPGPRARRRDHRRRPAPRG